VLTFKLTADLAVGEGPEAARELLLATRLQPRSLRGPTKSAREVELPRRRWTPAGLIA
jgi:hypothetical protein